MLVWDDDDDDDDRVNQDLDELWVVVVVVVGVNVLKLFHQYDLLKMEDNVVEERAFVNDQN
jgi:hypothetical protein